MVTFRHTSRHLPSQQEVPMHLVSGFPESHLLQKFRIVSIVGEDDVKSQLCRFTTSIMQPHDETGQG